MAELLFGVRPLLRRWRCCTSFIVCKGTGSGFAARFNVIPSLPRSHSLSRPPWRPQKASSLGPATSEKSLGLLFYSLERLNAHVIITRFSWKLLQTCVDGQACIWREGVRIVQAESSARVLLREVIQLV